MSAMRFSAGKDALVGLEEGWRRASARWARASASSGWDVWRRSVAFARRVEGVSVVLCERGVAVPFKTDLLRFELFLDGLVLAIGGLVGIVALWYADQLVIISTLRFEKN